jgi:hypothetical protein
MRATFQQLGQPPASDVHEHSRDERDRKVQRQNRDDRQGRDRDCHYLPLHESLLIVDDVDGLRLQRGAMDAKRSGHVTGA